MAARRRCRHDNLRGIYGDEIIARGYKRSQCTDCGRLFDSLPPDWMRPFFTRDYHGNVYSISHGNVATDAPTPVTLVPVDAEEAPSDAR